MMFSPQFRLSHPRTVFFFLLLAGLASNSARAGMIPSMGLAGDYVVYGSHMVDITVSSGSTLIEGNVAAGPNGDFTFSGGGTITGRLDHDAGTSVTISGGSQVLGGQFLIDMVPVDDDAHQGSADAAALTPTQSFASLGNGDSITGNGGLNVIDITGNILLSGGNSLTLTGSASDFFVFNIHGTMTLTGGSSTVLAGVDPGQVLWNFIGAGSGVEFNGNSTVFGTVLAIERNITVSGGTVTGALISNGDMLTLQSGPHVIYSPFVPEPSTVSLIVLGAIALLRRRHH